MSAYLAVCIGPPVFVGFGTSLCLWASASFSSSRCSSACGYSSVFSGGLPCSATTRFSRRWSRGRGDRFRTPENLDRGCFSIARYRRQGFRSLGSAPLSRCNRVQMLGNRCCLLRLILTCREYGHTHRISQMQTRFYIGCCDDHMRLSGVHFRGSWFVPRTQLALKVDEPEGGDIPIFALSVLLQPSTCAN